MSKGTLLNVKRQTKHKKTSQFSFTRNNQATFAETYARILCYEFTYMIHRGNWGAAGLHQCLQDKITIIEMD
jgi:hypothetical protein